MYKKTKMDMIQLVLLIILIISIPLLFISFESFQKLRALYKSNNTEVAIPSLEEIYEENSSVYKTTSASDLRNILNEIFELINNKDFNKLYSLLTDDIKELMFPTQDSFESYMKTSFDKSYSPSIKKYTKLNREKNEVFIIDVDFLLKSTKEFNIENDNVEKTDTFVIYLGDDGNYKFSFMSFIGTGDSGKAYSKDDFSCKILKTYLYNKSTTFVIEVENKSDSTITIGENEIYCYTGAVPRYYPYSVSIAPHTTRKISFTIYTGLSVKNSLPSEINIQGIHSNGMVYLFYIPVKYPINL
jgi:hypothetical protein